MLIAAVLILTIRVGYNKYGVPLVVNYTKSEPFGIYKAQKIRPDEITVGMMVMFPVPNNHRELVYGRQWVGGGLPLIKNVGALSGSEICTFNDHVEIDGISKGKVFTKDSAGRPLPKVRGCFKVKPGYFYPFSDYIEKSFDGRYIGQQPLTIITARLEKLWTF